MKSVMVFVVAAAAATALVAGAGAGGERTAAGVRLTSMSSINRYLASIGVDPRTVVVQRGRNYAGPRCPGKKWNCTSARRVIQISYHQNPNVFGARPQALEPIRRRTRA